MNPLIMIQIVMLLDIVSTQSIVRRWAAVRKTTYLKKRRASVIRIQAAARGYIAYTNFVFTLIDIIFCQAVVRSKLARKQREKLLCDHTSQHEMASSIQYYWRSHSAKKRIKSVTLIQAFTRRHIARKHLAKIQAYDACRNRVLFKIRERAAAIILQQFWEWFKLRRFQRSATSIQRAWRSHINFLRADHVTLNKLVFIQAIVRRILTQRRTACALRHVAISESDNIMIIENEAIITLQNWWRKRIHFAKARKNFQAGLSLRHASATVIVSEISLSVTRLLLASEYTISIVRFSTFLLKHQQSAFRGYVAFSQYVIICYFILKLVSAQVPIVIYLFQMTVLSICFICFYSKHSSAATCQGYHSTEGKCSLKEIRTLLTSIDASMW